MMFRVLGPLEVDVGAAPIVPPGARTRALLTALLLRPNTVVPAYRLVEDLWGNEPPDKPDNALHQLITRLRRALGPVSQAIVTRPPGYLLVAADSTIDAQRFEAQCQAARTRSGDDPQAAVRLLDEALALWRGPAYGEFADGFAQPAATRLEELRLAALEDRAALLLAGGSPAQAVASASDLAAQQPLRERPVEVLMRALHAAGRAGEALEAYRRHRQILASELGLDPTPRLRDLEARILRDDLEAPERSDLPIPSAPGSPVDTHRRELPWRPSRLIGREEELRLLAESLSKRRLVTMVGPGGVGKTRLALEVAHRLVEQGRSVWWADLTSVTAERVVDALADATGAEVRRTTDPAGALCAALRARHGVLCLDNAEHLLTPLAPVIERLIGAAPDVVVLATSRERLALDGESVRVLAPLPLPEAGERDNPAVRLFVDRASGLERESLTDDDIGVVAEVCRRLDGLPLAIELGAARTSAFGLRQLADRLGERLDLLAGGRRTSAARHRTLRAVVDWSHDLLTDDEARLFCRLAVFPGAFSLNQVEAVCADERLSRTSIPALVARLVEQSLVQGRGGRFWLLETLRAYAGERLLAAGDEQSLRNRHAHDTAERLATLDRQLWTPDEAAAVVDLTEHVVDLHAAWDHAVSNDRSLAVQLAGDVYDFAYVRQRLDLLAWGLRVASWHIDHPRLPRALAAAAAAAWAAGRMAEAEAHATRAVTYAVEDPLSAGRAVSQLGNLAMFTGRYGEAVVRFRRAGEIHRAAGEHVRALANDISVAQALTYAGRSAEARDSMEHLVARAHQTANPSVLSWAYYVAGEANSDADVERALAAYATAIEWGSKADAGLFVMIARSSAVVLAARSGPPAVALEQFRQILEQWERLGNEMAEWWVLSYLVVFLDRVDAAADAAVLAGAVLAAGDRRPSVGPFEVPLESALARVRDRLGVSATEDALAEGATLPYPAVVARARGAIVSAQRRCGC